jgi:ATP-dependent protease HslVU (ClpYQ) peptidase subunit
VTVAIAITAIDGTVIASDRQQTEEALKANEGKTSGMFVLGRGSLMISGAGNGPYLDAFADQINDWWEGENTPIEKAKIYGELQERHDDFYRRYVLPFSRYAEYERPDYELLVVASTTHARSIWTSHKLVVNSEDNYAAVGSGGTVAKALLRKFHVPYLPLDVAINLAAYVVYQVKQTVDGVGFETDVYEINARTHIPTRVLASEIATMEATFHSYEMLEKSNLYYCLGGNVTQAQRAMMPDLDDATRRESIREFFQKLNAERDKQWQRHQPSPFPSR